MFKYSKINGLCYRIRNHNQCRAKRMLLIKERFLEKLVCAGLDLGQQRTQRHSSAGLPSIQSFTGTQVKKKKKSQLVKPSNIITITHILKTWTLPCTWFHVYSVITFKVLWTRNQRNWIGGHIFAITIQESCTQWTQSCTNQSSCQEPGEPAQHLTHQLLGPSGSTTQEPSWATF